MIAYAAAAITALLLAGLFVGVGMIIERWRRPTVIMVLTAEEYSDFDGEIVSAAWDFETDIAIVEVRRKP
jgi:hypothetical protein